ncbi:Hypothetical predicted protein [Paramuricea clavata]|uniref:Uncharacterized protein n=1 Tax=Paramuricea clavata TaxID=317549 RepID=A0A7D9HUD5_PARCT|nr:Hypothetical predicted protein [Paramuricea clavata]
MLPHQSDTGVQSAEVSVITCTGDISEVSNLTTENNDYGAEIPVAKIDIISPIDNSSLVELENFIDDSFCNIMNSRHSEVTKGTVEQVFVNSTPFKQCKSDSATIKNALFDNFKEKVECEISNLLAKLTKQDETININKQDICKLREENLHLKSRISKLEGMMASAFIEKLPGAIEISCVTPTTQYVPISTKEKANEDRLPENPPKQILLNPSKQSSTPCLPDNCSCDNETVSTIPVIISKRINKKYNVRYRHDSIRPNNLIKIPIKHLPGSQHTSLIEYACPVYHDGLPTYLSSDLETIQRRAMRIIYPTESYEDALLLSGLTSLFLRRQQITNKVFLNIMNDDVHKLYTNYCLLKTISRLIYGKSRNSITQE